MLCITTQGGLPMRIMRREGFGDGSYVEIRSMRTGVVDGFVIKSSSDGVS